MNFLRLTFALALVALIFPSLIVSETAREYLRLWSSVESWTIRLEQQPSLLIKPARHIHAKNVLTLDLSEKFQTLVGFGGAITEAATHTISKLPASMIDRIVSAYYGPDGHQYSLARLPINSCDFSLGSYSFDDTVDDFELKNFDRDVRHDNETIIPFIKRAIKASRNKLKFFASPWSPPAWMKSNNAMTGSNSPCLKEGEKYQQVWADYYVEWIKAYKKHGIEVFGVTVQNEPEFAAPWEACSFTPREEREFVESYLSPTLRAFNPDLQIIGYDHNKDHVEIWADELLKSEDFDSIGVHWYSGDAFDLLENVHQKYPKKTILATEACNCPGVRINAWDRGEKYAHDIIGDLNHWVTGWVDWNIALDHSGGPNHLGNVCDAHIIVRDDWTNSPSLHFQPSYYIVGHFARFLPPGSIRVAHNLKNRDGNQEIHTIGRDHGDLGAGSISPQQSANIASDNTNIEIFTAIVPASAKTVHNDNVRHESEVVIVLFNPSNEEENVKILMLDDQAVNVRVPAHSIHTLTGKASLFGSEE